MLSIENFLILQIILNTTLPYKTNQLLKREVNILFSSPKQVFITLLIADLALQKNYFWINFLQLWKRLIQQ